MVQSPLQREPARCLLIRTETGWQVRGREGGAEALTGRFLLIPTTGKRALIGPAEMRAACTFAPGYRPDSKLRNGPNVAYLSSCTPSSGGSGQPGSARPTHGGPEVRSAAP
jgi:hypothetical protein